MLAAGGFTHLEGVPAARLARLDNLGRRLPGFAPILADDQHIVAVAPLPAGGVVLAIRSGGVASPGSLGLVRFEADGSATGLVDAFSEGATVRLTPCADGHVIVSGLFSSLGGHACNGLMRLRPDGSIDSAWRPLASDRMVTVSAVAAAGDGSVFVSALDYPGAETQQIHLVRISDSGALAARYAVNQPLPYQHLAVQSDGSLLAANHRMSPLFSVGTDAATGALLYRLGLVRYLPNGDLDPTFGASLPVAADCSAVATLADDRILVEMTGAEGADAGHRTVLLLSPDGLPLLDVREWLGAERDVQLLGVETAGTVLVRHGLATAGYAIPFGDPSGAIAPPLPHSAPWLDQRVSRLTLAPPGVARLSLAMTARLPGSIHALQRDAEGRILVSGEFSEIDGMPRPGVARYLPAGVLDASFRPADGSLGYSELELATNDGGVVLRTTYLSRRASDGFYEQPWRFVRLRPDGTTDPTFLLPAELILPRRQLRWHLAAPDGRFLVSFFAPDNDEESNLRLAWLRSDGRVDAVLPTRFSGLDPMVSVLQGGAGSELQVVLPEDPGVFGNPISEIIRLADGRLLVSGAFRWVDGVHRPGLARLHPDGTIDSGYRPEIVGADIVQARLAASGMALISVLQASTGREEYVHFRLRNDGSWDPGYLVCQGMGHWPPREESTGLPDLNFPVSFTALQGGHAWMGAHVRAADDSLWALAHGVGFGGLLARFVPEQIAEITAQPQPLNLFAGSDGCLQVAIGTDVPAQFQWFRNGVPIEGETSALLRLVHASTSQSGSYAVRVQVNGSTLISDAVSVCVEPNSSRIVNFSARSHISPSSPQVVGFVVLEGSSKPVLLRAVGLGLFPFLASAGLLPDPVLDLRVGGAPLQADRGGILAPPIVALAETVGAFPVALPPIFGVNANVGSAIALPLDAGVFNAATASADGRAGLSLFECYTEPGAGAPRLANLSVLACTGEGHDAVTVGFVVVGNGPIPVLIRAIGPGLEPFGVDAFASDPRLVVRRDQLRIAVGENDDWAGDSAVTAAAEAAGAFPLEAASSDAAVLLNLESGAYTVTATAPDRQGGEVLVEVYLVGRD